jgi:hypothetical protein
MLVKDGNGTIIDFEWPSLWYWFKVSVTVCLGIFAAFVLLWIPITVVNVLFAGSMLRVMLGGGR